MEIEGTFGQQCLITREAVAYRCG